MSNQLLSIAVLLLFSGALPAQQAAVANQPPARPSPVIHQIVIPAGTVVNVRLAQSLDTKYTRPGDRFEATLYRPIRISDRVVVPRGTTFTGHVVEARPSGRLRGRAWLELRLDRFRLHGVSYPVSTAVMARVSGSHKKRNALLMGGGPALGAAIGGIAAGGVGALAGAGAGAAAGTTGAFITGRKNVKLPVETQLVFSLQSPVRVRS